MAILATARQNFCLLRQANSSHQNPQLQTEAKEKKGKKKIECFRRRELNPGLPGAFRLEFDPWLRAGDVTTYTTSEGL